MDDMMLTSFFFVPFLERKGTEKNFKLCLNNMVQMGKGSVFAEPFPILYALSCQNHAPRPEGQGTPGLPPQYRQLKVLLLLFFQEKK
ncbi:MAG: hypothetical protein HFF18_09620 [Oscillospiraceae bacterium]|nr:hypothetical protein [Oscillospiraceae bacterium]